MLTVFVFRRLQDVGVKVVEPSSGYYIFPDFEVIRGGLAARGIHTGKEMCDAILKDIDVAVSLKAISAKKLGW